MNEALRCEQRRDDDHERASKKSHDKRSHRARRLGAMGIAVEGRKRRHSCDQPTSMTERLPQSDGEPGHNDREREDQFQQTQLIPRLSQNSTEQ